MGVIISDDRSRISVELSTTFTSTPLMIMRSYHACHRTVYLIVLPLAVLLIVLGIVTRRAQQTLSESL
jgi:hypothetical protein